jgi:hypothetical protein
MKRDPLPASSTMARRPSHMLCVPNYHSAFAAKDETVVILWENDACCIHDHLSVLFCHLHLLSADFMLCKYRDEGYAKVDTTENREKRVVRANLSPFTNLIFTFGLVKKS